MHTPSPLVSIVMPVFDDEDWIAEALESCLAQTLDEIEIICVDDASTDSTPAIIERYQQDDSRIRLIRQPENRSAFQARREGVLAASAPYTLFLDGDDELDPRAAVKAVAKAQATGADLVGFGVAVLGPDGRSVGGYQKRLQPTHSALEGTDILRTFFPVGKRAQGQLWRFLFSSQLLRDAYDLFPEDLVLPRVNDLPITFVVAASAQHYVSIPDHLYRYYFRRGGSGHRVERLEQFEFYASSIDSVESMAPAVRALARRIPDPEPVLDGYETARRSMIGNVLDYLIKSSNTDLHTACLQHLHDRVPATDVVLAAAEYAPDALILLCQHGARVELEDRPVRNVLLTTKALTTGGVSQVLLAQAHHLSEAGYKVTIAARRPNSILDGVPDGVDFVEVTGSMPERLQQWADICRDHEIDVIIDHQVLYSRNWATYALMARGLGVPTIGWIHNFAMRPVYNLKDLLSFIGRRADSLAMLVTLSALDTAFWKLRGVSHTAWLPNPPSSLLRETATTNTPKAAPQDTLQLVWWGRLEEHTKQVSHLIDVAAELRKLDVDFKLSVIGPDWEDMTADRLAAMAARRKVSKQVDVVGPLHGQELLDAIDAAHVFVSTSIIEGYQLTLAEAQARGLPAAMYELPWLTIVQDNEGVVTAPQGDAETLARRIAEISEAPDRYADLSQASLDASRRALSPDFSKLYQQLITGTLPEEFSPEPTMEDAQEILEWMIFFTEQHAGMREKLAKATTSKKSATKNKPAAKKKRTSKNKSTTKNKRTTNMRPEAPANWASGSTGNNQPHESDLVLRLRPVARRVYRHAPFMRPVGHQVKRAGGRVKRRLNLDL
ncbi:glycosyltransferase [Nesterenkonia sp. F]|uniref:glycosyltransferase n=1 Tax=Nesterenkonia sp. F TaxID=795955 RepID=UPI000255CE3A|nr:glycosyltransferase [Nesterenkonia sp. F]